MRKLFLSLATTLVATSAAATPPIMPAGPPPQPPARLVVAISVDQLSADLFDQYRSTFTGGLARLQQGTTFLNGYQSHAATETCPGHATLLTGRRPAANGITANEWIDQAATREDKTIYCAEDERVAGTSSRSYSVSPQHLRSATLGDLLKSVSPGSRNVAVAGKDRAAVMMGGRLVDQRWYWDGAKFATDLKTVAEPQAVTAVNRIFAAQVSAPGLALEAPPLCQARSRAYTLAPGVTVGAGRLDRAAGDARAMRASPQFDGAVLALAAGLIQEMRLGRGDATSDVISIGLSATDYVGHSFGTGGSEMCLQLLALDRELGDFLALLDSTGVDYLVVLTADHGALDIPERLREQGVPAAQRADPMLAPQEVGKRVAARLGRSQPALRGISIGGDVWLDRSLSASDRQRALREAVAAYQAHPQVAAVFTSAELAATPSPSGDVSRWSLRDRARASFDPDRSGDLIVVLKEHVSHIAAPSRGYVAGHGSPWDYDRRVPILFWRKGAQPSVRNEAVETAAILPTLAPMINLSVPQALDGACIEGVLGRSCR